MAYAPKTQRHMTNFVFMSLETVYCQQSFQKASGYFQEMPQSQTTDQPMAPRERDI